MIFKMMYKNVSYNHGEFHGEPRRTNVRLNVDTENETTQLEDEIWTAMSFSPDPNYNKSYFDIPFQIESPSFDRRRKKGI